MEIIIKWWIFSLFIPIIKNTVDCCIFAYYTYFLKKPPKVTWVFFTKIYKIKKTQLFSGVLFYLSRIFHFHWALNWVLQGKRENVLIPHLSELNAQRSGDPLPPVHQMKEVLKMEPKVILPTLTEGLELITLLHRQN